MDMLGLKPAPHRTTLYRTRKRLSEEYMERLNNRILERLKPTRKVGADATGVRMVFSRPGWQKGIP